MPTIKITRRTVAALEAKPTRYVAYDADLKGFGVRVMPSGAKSYIVEYRPGAGGRGVAKKRIAIGNTDTLTPEGARKEAGGLLAKVRLGGDPASERKGERDGATVREVVEAFLNDHAKAKRKARTAKGYESLFNQHILPAFGTRKAVDLADDDMSKLHLKLKATKGRANRLLSAVSSMYTFAAKRRLVAKGFNPAQDIERYPERRKERFLTVEELGRIGDAIREAETVGIAWEPNPSKKVQHAPRASNRRTTIDPFAAAALRLLLFTGARLSEILNLEWAHYDVGRGLLLLPDSKTGEKTIVLNAPAVAVLAELPRLGRYVIAGASAGTDEEKPRSDLKRPWGAIAKLAGLVETVQKLGKDKRPLIVGGEPVMRHRVTVRLHDLRHTHASFGAGAGLGLPIIGKLLGHVQASTTQRYAHLDNDPLRKASERIAGDIAAAMGDKVAEPGEVVPMRRR
jgi:integrase